MSGIWLWVRSEWRRGWLGLAALTLLIAVVGGVTMAVAAGARRADTALARFTSATNHPRAEVELVLDGDVADIEARIASLPPAAVLADRVAAVPGVDGLLVMQFIGATPAGDGEFFNAGIAARRGDGPRQFLVAGRSPDPGDPHEVLVNETAAEEWGSVGDTVTLHTLDPGQIRVMAGLDSGEPGGPEIDVRVVGITRDIEAITDAPEPILITSPAFIERYDGQVLMFPGLIDVTAGDVAGDRLDAFVADIGAAAGDAYFAHPQDEDFAGRADDAISVEVTALSVFAFAAALAGLIVLYQAMARQAILHGDEVLLRRAIGLTRRDEVVGSVLRTAPAVASGALGAFGLAIALSPLLPRGLARRAEIAPGVFADRTVLLIGVLLLALLGAGMAAVTGWLVTRRPANGTGLPSTATPDPLRRAAGVLSPAGGLGLRSALAPRGRWAQAGWAGLAGVAVAVAGFLAVVAVDRSAERLTSTPRMYGAGWDAIVEVSPDVDTDQLVARLTTDADVSAIGRQDTLAAESVRASGPGGAGLVEPEALEPVLGAIAPTLTAGRLPTGPSEVAIGATVADNLGAEIGDTVEVDAYEGPVELVVVGRILNAGTNDLGSGFLLSRAGLGELTDGCPADSDEIACLVITEGFGVSFAPGVDRDDAILELSAIVPGVSPTPVPSVVHNLDQIGSTPWMLAGFLGLLAVAGLFHAMATGSRNRDHDLAVGRALGLRPRQAAASVRWQAVVLAIAGAAVGVLLGVVAGRFVWQRVAVGTGALVETVVPVWAMVAAPAAAIVVALIIAVPSGWRATRLRPSVVLRSE